MNMINQTQQISLPLDTVGFLPRYVEPISAPRVRVAKPPATPAPASTLEEKKSCWSDADIRWLCWNIFEESLDRLKSGRNRAACKQEMEWILSDDTEGFSFRVCAEILGMDADELRQSIVKILK